VCFGGNFGKVVGNPRNVAGTDCGTLSSSDGSWAGDGERDRAGIRTGVGGTAVRGVIRATLGRNTGQKHAQHLHFFFFFLPIFVLMGRSDSGAILNSSQARTMSVAMAADLLDKLAYWCARSYSRSMTVWKGGSVSRTNERCDAHKQRRRVRVSPLLAAGLQRSRHRGAQT
jgi:hypothetical protein